MKDLRELKVDDLRDIGREYGIMKLWKMTKSEMIAEILKRAEFCGHTDKYFDSEAQNEPEQTQNEPELTEEPQSDNYKAEEEKPTERNQEPSNSWELIAKKQLNNAYNQIVGANENAVSDGEMTNEEFNKWIAEEALDEVYHEAITTEYGEDYCGREAPTEMRFAGKDFCYKYLKRLFKRDGYKPQNAPYDTRKPKSSNLSGKDESSSGLKSYAAWVVDRETKEITTIFGEADCREDFYNSIKSKYRVRLITKPEKLEEECKQWEVKHAQNKIKKNEKYAADKIEAQKMNMSVGEYRKWLRESAKTE